MFLYKFVSLMFLVSVCNGNKGDEIGCYMFLLENVLNTHTGQSVDVCLSACEQIYYKYALLADGSDCYCGNEPGTMAIDASMCNLKCSKNSTQICGGKNVASVYDTNFNTAGPPDEIYITNTTETACMVKWKQPQAYTSILGYSIKTIPTQTYSDNILLPIVNDVSNKTLSSWVYNLHPGTKYRLNVAANTKEGLGLNATIKCETVIGYPDPEPPEVEIKGRHGDKMVIHIPKAKNFNGPISRYRIVVAIEMYSQGFVEQYLKPYKEAQDDGLTYYITAEIDPDEAHYDFTIGDGKWFNGIYYNAPLPLTNDIEVTVGIVSEKNNVVKVRYAGSAKDRVILNVNDLEEWSGVVVGLSVAIAVGIALILIGLGFIILIRKRTQYLRAHRSSQSMPLSPSEPCADIENAGFLPEVEEHIDHYNKLRRKIWNIPRNLIDMDTACIVGVGTYGRFTKGFVRKNNEQIKCLIQVIADRDLQRENRRQMLHELDPLIKTSDHENVISLIGISETNITLYVALEDCWNSLKDHLLNSRSRDGQRFTYLSEKDILDFAIGIGRGMEYLAMKKITHKRLCCRNIFLSESGIPKVAGFGLSHIHPIDQTPDYTRWTAQEVFKRSKHTIKSDVWSFGCTLWELFTLGGTLYSNVSSSEVAARVLRGMRPLQPTYIGDELYQLCLECWQIDLDERPSFTVLISELEIQSINYGVLSYSSNEVSYEPYLQHLELIS